MFAARCADCHGPDAKGKLGPDITQRWARGETDESAFRIIRNGVPGSSMPPNVGPTASLGHRCVSAQHQRRSCAREYGQRGARPGAFANDCAGCHQVRGAGGALGPDLSSVGITRSRVAFTAALRDPSATMALGFRAVAFEGGGERVKGVVKAEDAFSLQVVTLDGELRGFTKRELDGLVRSTSR